jgi:hypothetical protein
VAQVLHVVATAGNGLLLFSAVDVVAEGPHGVVALASSPAVTVLVVVFADQASAFCSFENPDRAR